MMNYLEEIDKSVKKMVEEQNYSNNSVLISQERLKEGIDSIVANQKRLENGIASMAACLNKNLSIISWQLELNRKTLKSIEEALWKPFDVKALNLKQQAEEYSRYEWYDEAEKTFLKSLEYVSTDFSIHISLGLIYYFIKEDKKKALESFEYAIKYSKPRAPFYCSYALLFKAKIKYEFGDLIEAEKCTEKAISLSMDYAEAYYQNAQYNAQLENKEEALLNLKEAIKSDALYCFKIDKDLMFEPIRNDVNILFKSLTDEIRKRCSRLWEKLIATVNSINIVMKETAFELKYFNNEFEMIEMILSRNTYYDCLEGENRLHKLNKLCKVYFENSQKYLKSGLEEMNSKIDKIQKELIDSKESFGYFLGAFGGLLVCVPSAYFSVQFEKYIRHHHSQILIFKNDIINLIVGMLLVLSPIFVFILLLTSGFFLGKIIGTLISKLRSVKKSRVSGLQSLKDKKKLFENLLAKIRAVKIE